MPPVFKNVEITYNDLSNIQNLLKLEVLIIVNFQLNLKIFLLTLKFRGFERCGQKVTNGMGLGAIVFSNEL